MVVVTAVYKGPERDVLGPSPPAADIAAAAAVVAMVGATVAGILDGDGRK